MTQKHYGFIDEISPVKELKQDAWNGVTVVLQNGQLWAKRKDFELDATYWERL